MQIEETLVEDKPRFRERLIARIARVYPLNSGRGTLANSGMMDKLAGMRKANVFARVFGHRVFVPIDDFVGRSMFFFGDLDNKISWVVRTYVKPGDVVLDIGANLGLVTTQMAKIVGPKGQVHAFEPNPLMCGYLHKTFKANPNLKIKLHQIGLGAEEGQLTLSVPQGNAGAASFVPFVDGSEIVDSAVVPVRRLSDLCEDEGVPQVDFVKMDVEGYEPEVLSGGYEVLKKYRPRAILFEENYLFKMGKRPRSFDQLEDLGYSLHAIPKSLFRHKVVPLEDPRAMTAHDFLALRD